MEAPVTAIFMEPLVPFAIEVPQRGSRQIIRALHQQFQRAILEGRLHPGLRLPSTRGLASQLGVSRNAVLAVYDMLLAQGYLTAKGGAGTYVATSLRSLPKHRGARSRGGDPRIVPAWHAAKASVDGAPNVRCDFRVGIPDVRQFPAEVWRRLWVRELRKLSRASACYGEPEGSPALRQAIAAHVSFARAVSCSPESIIVTSGAQQAFDLIAKVLVSPKQTVVAVEDPGYPPARKPFEAAGAHVVGVPVDGEGLVVDELPARARVIVTTPSHQFPLGMALSLERRLALLEFARDTGAVIVEDDYDGEFRYLGRPLDSLQTLDRSQSVFYVGTFSKSLSPDLRLGFVVAPEWARDAIARAKRASDWNCPTLAQEVLANFISGGHLARHLRRMRRVYGERRRLLLGALARYRASDFKIYPSETGIHIAVGLPRRVPAEQLALRAAECGIAVQPLGPYGLGHRPAGIAFGLGGIVPEVIDGAVLRLAELASRLRAGTQRY